MKEHYKNIEVTSIQKFKVEREGFVLNWSCKGIGFGQLTIEQTEDGEFKMDTECMGDEFAKAVLCNLVDKSKK